MGLCRRLVRRRCHCSRCPTDSSFTRGRRPKVYRSELRRRACRRRRLADRRKDSHRQRRRHYTA
jgi:hypothetical protein